MVVSRVISRPDKERPARRLHRGEQNWRPPMTSSASPFGLRSDFDPFLSAPVGEEPNGMTLSVVSALARTGVDPWREAAELSRLPRRAATERLAALIAALPGAAPTGLPPGVVPGLIALLPTGQRASGPPREAKTAQSSSNFWTIVFCLLSAALMLGSQRITESRRASSPETSRATAAAAAAPTARQAGVK